MKTMWITRKNVLLRCCNGFTVKEWGTDGSNVQYITFPFKYFVSIFLLKGMKMALCVSGTPQGSVFTPCTSSAQRESSSQTPTQMTTWTRAVRESGLHSARSGLTDTRTLNFLLTQLFTDFIRHVIGCIYCFSKYQVGCFDPYSDDPRLGIQKIHLCKYSGYLTVAGTAGQVSVSQWEFKWRQCVYTSLKQAILKWYLLFSCYLNYYIFSTKLHLCE